MFPITAKAVSAAAANQSVTAALIAVSAYSKRQNRTKYHFICQMCAVKFMYFGLIYIDKKHIM